MSRRAWSVFFDTNMSYRLCNMIKAMEEGRYPIVHAKDHPKLKAGANRLGNSTPDIEWLTILSDDDGDCVAVSNDTDIIDTPQEREVLKNSGITFFAFDKYFADADKYGQAVQIVQMWPKIVQISDACQSGIFIVKPKKQVIDKVADGFNSKGRRL